MNLWLVEPWRRAVWTWSQWQEMSIVMESWNRNMKLG